MRTINLLPKSEQREFELDLLNGQVTRFWILTIISLAVVLGLTVASDLYLSQQISLNQVQIDNKTRELRSSATKQLEEEVTALNRQIRLIDSLRQDHYLWSRALVELTYLVDSGARLTAIQLDRETGKVTVNGIASDRDNLLAFWSATMKSEVFHGINFPLTNLEQDKDAPFTFTFYVLPEEIKE